MKKLLLSIGFVCAITAANSQVVLDILSPSSIAANVPNNFVDVATWPGVPDMSDPNNAITDTLVLANDSLSCTGLTNDLTGKIAVIYRGGCEFGTKALNAQNAGAIGAILINPGGTPIAMGAGVDGPSVTIPVTMISAADGANIQAQLDMGVYVVAFWGALYGVNGNDLGMEKNTVLRAASSGVIAGLAQNDTEFSVPLGAWVYNYGYNDRTGVTVTADVSFGGSSVSNVVSASQDILAGDSAYYGFVNGFSQTSYANGDYTISYAIADGQVEDVTTNDVFTSVFTVNDNYYSLVPIDGTTGTPDPVTYASVPITINSGGAGFSQSESCIIFKDANASRVAVTGMTFSTSTYDPLAATTLDGEFLEFFAYEWTDQFADLNDPSFTLDPVSLNGIANTDFYYSSDDQGVLHSVDFEDPLVLVDNQRYLFCMLSYSEPVQFGVRTDLGYDESINTTAEPIVILNDGYGYYLGIIGDDAISSMVLKTVPSAGLSVNENSVDVTPFPNPTRDIVNIPLAGVDGSGSLSITDLTGKIVSTQTINAANGSKLAVDVSDLPSGVYVFNMMFDNGTTSSFNVAVTK